MTFSIFAKRVERLITNNSPAILTAIGVTGTVMTAYLTGKASFKAAEIIRDEEDSEQRVLDGKEKAELVWKLYIPAAATGAMTISCIIAANQLGTRRAAALATAYSLSEKAFVEYREKVVEKLGAKKEESVRDELAQDRVNKNPVNSREIIISGGGEVLCYEEFTGRYFSSDMQTLRKAQNDVNHQVNNCYYASLTDFYNAIGIPSTSYSDEVGWNCDRLLELRFSTTLTDDDRPCISMGFNTVPIRNYHRIQ